MSLDVKVGDVDFIDYDIKGLDIPKKSLLFTSYALHYDPKFNNNIFSLFEKIQPSVIINFEPCYELYSKDTIHGQMCKKYIIQNDYTKNIYSVFAEYSKNRKSKFNIIPNIIGDNFPMPISCLQSILS